MAVFWFLFGEFRSICANLSVACGIYTPTQKSERSKINHVLFNLELFWGLRGSSFLVTY